MPSHFENGILVEEREPEINEFANAALTTANAYFQKWNAEHPPGNSVVWLQATNGLTLIVTPDPKYAKKLIRVVQGLK